MMNLTRRLGLPRYEADEYYKLALTAFDQGDYDQAIDNLTKALALLPHQPEYLAARGYVYLQDGVRDKADADFEAALKQHEFEMLANFGRGVLAYQDRNWEDAETAFSRALGAMPERAETLYYLALVQHRQRKNEQALALMRQALERFEAANDKRRTDARQWVRELEKQVMI